MGDEQKPNIFKSKWARACRSCGSGGDGDPGTWQAVLLIGLLAGPPLAFAAYLWCSARGVQITANTCAWSIEEGQYLAHVRLQNSDPAFKLVTLRIQGRFRPPPGRQWPDPSIKNMYEAVSDVQRLELKPSGRTEALSRFSIPGTEGFLCEAKVWVVGQRAFSERPSEAVLNALK